LEAAGAAYVPLPYCARSPIFLQGSAADAVYYIEEGSVQISVVSEQGKEGVIAILGRGDFFGEECIAGTAARFASAVALRQTSAARISRETMIQMLQHHAAFAEAFTGFLLARNVQFEADLADHLFNSSEKRLARALLDMADFGEGGTKEIVIPRVSQEVLAAKVGTTRPRISYFMNKFRRLGFIDYGKELRIRSSLLDVIICDSEEAPSARRALGQKRPRKLGGRHL
jgi:CRP/FNR family transcriptional regulator, cyclic AMP receptor protein